jgi:hypothetical protein
MGVHASVEVLQIMAASAAAVKPVSAGNRKIATGAEAPAMFHGTRVKIWKGLHRSFPLHQTLLTGRLPTHRPRNIHLAT